MSKSKSDAAPPKSKAQAAVDRSKANRETVESIVVAIILALLFRAFVAEAFVIPTGSMAPTLQGTHMDVWCEKCNYNYRTGASSENLDHHRPEEVLETTCPICRYHMTLNKRQNWNHNSFNGDRIIVSKFAYTLGEPHRWDVFVFKYPGNAKQNYIKRLVGMPNEILWVRHGDVFSTPRLFKLPWSSADLSKGDALPDALRKGFEEHGIKLSPHAKVHPVLDQWKIVDSESPQAFRAVRYTREKLRNDPFDDSAPAVGDLPDGVLVDELHVFPAVEQILRKPPHKLLAMLHTVDDTDYIPAELTDAGWPSRWLERTPSPQWQVDQTGHRFVLPAGDKPSWLRYRHVVPTDDDWAQIEAGRTPGRLNGFRGQLITDYYAYNDVGGNRYPKHRSGGLNWVSDLALEAKVEVTGNQGHVLLDLVRGGVHFQCSINVADGKATLTRGDGKFSDGVKEAANPSGTSNLIGPGKYSLRLSNVDQEVLLWVNNKLVEFDGPTTYEDAPENPQWSKNDAGDLEPAGIAAEGVGLTVSNLKVLRDVYYISTESRLVVEFSREVDYDLPPGFFAEFGDPYNGIHQHLSSPELWAESKLFDSRRTSFFVLSDDQFFPLGDNSPQSKDGRLWAQWDGITPSERFVHRDLLIGRALLIYWPHSWWTPPYINFKRMGLIR